MGERVLVTGATGFIGRNLIRALVRQGDTVRALVRDPLSHALPPGVETHVGDLLDPASLSGISQGVGAVIHGASLLGKWGTEDAQLYDVNVRGTLHLLEELRGGEIRRFVHLSAGGVTGPIASRAVGETYECAPATTYERTKLLAERKVLDLAREAGFPAVVVRPTFTYGPGDPHKLALFRAVKKGRYLFIGDGQSVNHPVYVDDLVAGILLALAKGRVGEIYIVGGEAPVTKRELVYTIADALGVSKPAASIPVWVARLAAPGLELLGRAFGFEPILTRSRVMMMADNFGYSIDKAKNELGYRPAVDLRTGITRTVDSYRQAGLL